MLTEEYGDVMQVATLCKTRILPKSPCVGMFSIESIVGTMLDSPLI